MLPPANDRNEYGGAGDHRIRNHSALKNGKMSSRHTTASPRRWLQDYKTFRYVQRRGTALSDEQPKTMHAIAPSGDFQGGRPFPP